MTASTTVIELWGGPGCGKSTLAAALYGRLSASGVSVELVREYVKAWAWRGHKIGKWDELYILAKQLRAEADVYDKAKFVVTDRPLGLSCVYEELYNPATHLLRDTVQGIDAERQREGINTVAFMVMRPSATYNPAGRFEDEGVARKVDRMCARYLAARDAGGEVVYVSNVEHVRNALLARGLL